MTFFSKPSNVRGNLKVHGNKMKKKLPNSYLGIENDAIIEEIKEDKLYIFVSAFSLGINRLLYQTFLLNNYYLKIV